MSSIECADCLVNTCLMWRRTKRGLIVCNTCHLKRLKSSGNGVGISKQKDGKRDFVRQSSRKSKPSSKISKSGNGKYWDKSTKSSFRNRKSMMKRKPTKSLTVSGAVVTSKSIYHQGLLYKEGDIVSVVDINGEKYFAQLRGFLQDIHLNKSAAITWLLPTVANPTKFDPAVFLPGPDEDIPRPMECFEFVSRAPTNLFKLRTSYPPYLRTKADLSSLLAAADEVLQPSSATVDENSYSEEKTES